MVKTAEQQARRRAQKAIREGKRFRARGTVNRAIFEAELARSIAAPAAPGPLQGVQRALTRGGMRRQFVNINCRIAEGEAEATELRQSVRELGQQLTRKRARLAALEAQVTKDREEAAAILARLTKVRSAGRLEARGERQRGGHTYAHKYGVNKILSLGLVDAARRYAPGMSIHDCAAFVLDGPDCRSTQALNDIGVSHIHIINDNRHGDYPAIHALMAAGEIQAEVFKTDVAGFLASSRNMFYNFVFYDSHGFTGRLEEFDALLDHLARPFCYFAASFQTSGAGVCGEHGLVRRICIQEGGDEHATDVVEHTELQDFQAAMERRTHEMNIIIRKTEDMAVPGRGSATRFQVRVWHLDTSGPPASHGVIPP